jgi:hypothetical protein
MNSPRRAEPLPDAGAWGIVVRALSTDVFETNGSVEFCGTFHELGIELTVFAATSPIFFIA